MQDDKPKINEVKMKREMKCLKLRELWNKQEKERKVSASGIVYVLKKRRDE
jgi:hypothetical protein